MKILDNFDRAMFENLSANVKTRVTFKVSAEFAEKELALTHSAGPPRDVPILRRCVDFSR
jgi:hypothetical protein